MYCVRFSNTRSVRVGGHWHGVKVIVLAEDKDQALAMAMSEAPTHYAEVGISEIPEGIYSFSK